MHTLGRFACPALWGTDRWAPPRVAPPRVALHRPNPQWLLRWPPEGRPGWLVDGWMPRQRGCGKLVVSASLPPHRAKGLRQRVCTASERLALHHTWRWTPSCPCLCHQHTRPGGALGEAGELEGQQSTGQLCLALSSTPGPSSHVRSGRSGDRGGHVFLSGWGRRFGVCWLRPSPTSHCRRLLVPHPISPQTEVEAAVCGPDVRVHRGREWQVGPDPRAVTRGALGFPEHPNGLRPSLAPQVPDTRPS